MAFSQRLQKFLSPSGFVIVSAVISIQVYCCILNFVAEGNGLEKEKGKTGTTTLVFLAGVSARKIISSTTTKGRSGLGLCKKSDVMEPAVLKKSEPGAVLKTTSKVGAALWGSLRENISGGRIVEHEEQSLGKKSDDMENPAVVKPAMEGWLWKRLEGRSNGSPEGGSFGIKRYFALDGPSRVIKLLHKALSIEYLVQRVDPRDDLGDLPEDQHRFDLHLSGQNTKRARVMRLSAESAGERQKWIDAVNALDAEFKLIDAHIEWV